MLLMIVREKMQQYVKCKCILLALHNIRIMQYTAYVKPECTFSYKSKTW